jgi:copper chaperone CopZ
MTTVTYNIPNINCNHCVHTIKSEVSELAGVDSVDANLEQKKVTITFDPPATEKALVDLLTEINYPPSKN